ncbi:MAG: MurR/RpiR family transcriptional regulator [Rhodospirillaceae bacterium]|jgi:DNA-binding MurR/RpiR family transcriptional regulator|nr:MurR/RpiR family transcriptional regulator [Rhodospirillaceae bacterium]MBT6136026.1 MurR/RpiR family transcriptional regulator [Rhodospirillaceae bacterium]
MAATASAPASFDSLRHQIHELYDDLSPHLQRIAQHALDDPNTFALETVATLAARAEVQPSTMIRFAKEFGYTGFSEMQQVFKLRLIEGAPVYRERIFEHKRQLEDVTKDDPIAILREFCDASALCLEQLKDTVSSDDLQKAVTMLSEAEHIYVIGQRRAFPIASYLAYGLTRMEMRCQLLDFVGGMVPQQVATLRSTDLLVAISFTEYTPSVVEVVRDAHIRGVPTLTITDVPSSPLAKHGTVYFTVDNADVHQFKPIAGSIGLVQSLIIALSLGRTDG